MKPTDLKEHPEGGRFQEVFRSEATVTLSAASNRFCQVVPAGSWQAAKASSDAVLAGCSVAPGFEFEDFELLEPGSDKARLLQSIDPSFSEYLST